MFVGIKKGLFNKKATEEINVAISELDKKIEQKERIKSYKTAETLKVEINGVEENNSIKIGNSVFISVKLNSQQNTFNLPIKPFIAFTVGILVYDVDTGSSKIIYANIDINGTVSVDAHNNNTWINFSYLVTL